MPKRAAVRHSEVLNVHCAGVRRSHEQEDPRSVAAAREEERLDRVGAEVVARRLDPASAASAVLARGAIDPSQAARPDPG